MGKWRARTLTGLLAIGTAIMALSPRAPSDAAPARADDGSQPFWIEQIADGMAFPMSIAWLPNGDMLIPEREGGVRLLRKGVLDPKPLSGVPESFQNALNGPMDLVADPDFAENSLVYLLIGEGKYEAHGTAVFRMRWSPADHGFQDVTRIFRSKDNISGSGRTAGRLLFLTDKTLLIGVTEDNYHRPLAQRLDSHIGKILRINRDGSVPADNPFLGNPKALPEIWSYGHRVTSGLYRIPDTDEIYEVEPGPRGGDEFNLVKAGKNYGWAKVTWGFDYGGGVVSPHQFAPGVEDPIFVWMPAASPSGLTHYRGARYPRWNDSFFVGLLNGMALERVKLNGRKVLLREDLLSDFDERIRDVRVGPDGYIYLLTDRRNGRLLRLMPGKPKRAQLAHVAARQKPAAPASFVEYAQGDAAAGRVAFERSCAACHSVAETASPQDVGPNLRTVFARQAGALKGYGYSPAMAEFPQSWDVLSLNIFLANPAAYVPGTTMNAVAIDDPQERVDIITYLKQLGTPITSPEFTRIEQDKP